MIDDPDVSAANPPAVSRANLVAIARWLLLVAVSFGILAAGMGWIARSATIASPITQPATVTEPTGDVALAGSYPAPDFRLASLDGGELGPADFLGDVVLVEFWATWCGPCRQQAKFLEQLHRELDGKGVHFLAVDIGEQEAVVRRYVEKHPFPYPVLLDPHDTASPRYRIYGLPTVMIVNREGVITFLETGVSDTATLRRAIEAAG